MNNSILKKGFFTLLLIFSLQDIQAQDPQFSMFYSVPLYINPAFAGSRHANRAILHHRWQWHAQPGRYTTTMFSFDTYSPKYKSGIGGTIMQDYQSGIAVTATYASLIYSYELRLNSVHTLRFGIQGGFIQKSINIDGLTSQFTNEGQVGGQGFSASKIYPDISAGALWFARRIYASASFSHMNRPNEAMVSSIEARLPVKFTFAAGYKIPLVFNNADNGLRSGNPISMAITPTFTYKKQFGSENYIQANGTGDQIDIGLYWTYKWAIAGMWYRGIPFKRFEKEGGQKYQNSESVVFLVGASYLGIGFGYSYDLTVSTQGYQTGGAHELHLSYVFRVKHTKKPLKTLPCPDFEYDILQRGSAGRVK